MQLAEAPVHGAVCRLVWGGEKSTVSLSLLNDETESAALQRFGVLAYALPYKGKPVASILISSEDHMVVDCALQVAQMVAALVKRPVFVNTTIRNVNVLMLKSIKDFVNDEMKDETNTVVKAA